MRFNGERRVPATVDEVWAHLHDHQVLTSVVPGCAEMLPLGGGAYSAKLEARVGRIADTYRGTFTLTDVRPGAELRVRVRATGRFGRLVVALHVTLDGSGASPTTLRYDAEAAVSGLVSRLGRPALTVAGNQFTGCFFGRLERSVNRGHAGVRPEPARAVVGAA